MEKIEEWIESNYTSGYGNGCGNGCDYGNGSGNGCGNGYDDGLGYGDGDGSGLGSGFGSAYGSGCGSGSDSGYGSGYGSGFGCGDGDDYEIMNFNSDKVYIIDFVATIIKHIKRDIAKGFILNSDFTLTPTYIAKGQGYFAHGETIQKAVQSLREKIYDDLDTDEAIDKFMAEVDIAKKHKASEFYTWHHILTGSCEQGRKSFMKNHNISEDDEFTVAEFIDLTKNDYGGEIIQQLEDKIKESE